MSKLLTSTVHPTVFVHWENILNFFMNHSNVINFIIFYNIHSITRIL